MPSATPLPLRLRVAELSRAGAAPAAIAERLSLPPRTVRHLLARWRLAPGAGPAAAPRRGGRPEAAGRAAARDGCLALRRAHPGWGAGRLRVELLKSRPAGGVPCGRTLQRWLRRGGLADPPAGPASRMGCGRPTRRSA